MLQDTMAPLVGFILGVIAEGYAAIGGAINTINIGLNSMELNFIANSIFNDGTLVDPGLLFWMNDDLIYLLTDATAPFLNFMGEIFG